jgi:hypothetical protein
MAPTMTEQELPLPERKRLRAAVVKDYVCGMTGLGHTRVVCFSCGNASAALREAGLDVLDISPTGHLEAREWWTPARIAREWPHRFDATSGHLPLPLMVALAERLQQYLRAEVDPNGHYVVPSGSGETVLALRMAFPHARFDPYWNNERMALQYDAESATAAFLYREYL